MNVGDQELSARGKFDEMNEKHKASSTTYAF
jgi:hypothetical protein